MSGSHLIFLDATTLELLSESVFTLEALEETTEIWTKPLPKNVTENPFRVAAVASVAQIAFAYATLFNEILRCLLFSVAWV